jgi:alkylation response protein AidB-like acyl-CoA dehydrogenase
MTERGGGSDLTPTETTATYMPLDKGEASLDADGFPLGPWVINGFKWFSTATEGSMAIVLARTTKGLSAFYAPMRCMATDSKTFELNGVRIRRLKSKLGTKSLPTAELEINGMRAYLIGQDGKGIQEVGVVLNVTRIHLAVSGLGGWGRVLGATRAFARIRRVARGTRLSDVPLHMRTLANAHITYRAHMLLGFFVVSLLQSSEDIGKPETHSLIPKALQDVQCLLRLLGSVAKATIAKASVVGAQTAIESLGGLGYLENEETEFNVARLYRDAAVLCVGEGTTDVVATDVIKVFKGKIGSYVLKALGRWVTTSIPQHESMVDEKATLLQQWKDLQTAVSSNSFDHLVLNAREVMDHVCKLVCGILLLADAARDSDFVAAEIAQRWIKPPSGLVSGIGGEQELLMNQRIVFGNTSAWLAG